MLRGDSGYAAASGSVSLAGDTYVGLILTVPVDAESLKLYQHTVKEISDA